MTSTRQQQRSIVRQKKMMEARQHADRLRAEGKAEEADQLLVSVDLKPPPVVDPAVEDAVSALDAGKSDQFEQIDLTREQLREVRRRLSPDGVAAWKDHLRQVSERAEGTGLRLEVGEWPLNEGSRHG